MRSHLALHNGVLRAGPHRLRLSSFDRVFLVAVGKAAVPMAQAVEAILGRELHGGIVVTKHGHSSGGLRRCAIHETGHPVPDEHSRNAAEQIREMLAELNARDLLLVAVSGGASALVCAPVQGLTLAAKQETTNALLRAGARIEELNAVRKHLSFLKGGQLAALAYPATVVGLLLSDVIGDPLDVIGSGLTSADASTFGDARDVLAKYGLSNNVPASVRARIEDGLAGLAAETPKPRSSVFETVRNVIVGSNRLALEAAAAEAKALGYRTLVLASAMQGETREVAAAHAAILREVLESGRPVRTPACLLSGGETTVTVRGSGKGGRNQEFALAAALALDGLPGALVLSGGTDGTDGPTDAAGAIAVAGTLSRARKLGLDARDHLVRNDAYAFFDALGDLIRTGPTGTNVMDIHLLLAG